MSLIQKPRQPIKYWQCPRWQSTIWLRTWDTKVYQLKVRRTTQHIRPAQDSFQHQQPLAQVANHIIVSQSLLVSFPSWTKLRDKASWILSNELDPKLLMGLKSLRSTRSSPFLSCRSTVTCTFSALMSPIHCSTKLHSSLLVWIRYSLYRFSFWVQLMTRKNRISSLSVYTTLFELRYSAIQHSTHAPRCGCYRLFCSWSALVNRELVNYSTICHICFMACLSSEFLDTLNICLVSPGYLHLANHLHSLIRRSDCQSARCQISSEDSDPDHRWLAEVDAEQRRRFVKLIIRGTYLS